jgi:hypothetical protein
MFERTHRKVVALVFAIVVVAMTVMAAGCSNAVSSNGVAPSSTVIGGTTATAGAGPLQAGPLDAMPYVISAANGKLNVTSIEVPLNAAVVFENAEDDSTVQHQFVAVGGSFDTGPLDAGVRYLVYFDKEATVPFIDKLHTDLTGTVVVSTSVTLEQVAPAPEVLPKQGPWIGIRQGGPTTMNAEIKVGNAVNFYNDEDTGGPEHHIVADDGSFDSGVLQPNQSFTFTFNHAGAFAYHDVLDSSVKGTITVT